jgi:hypothetical protein
VLSAGQCGAGAGRTEYHAHEKMVTDTKGFGKISRYCISHHHAEDNTESVFLVGLSRSLTPASPFTFAGLSAGCGFPTR